MSLEGQRILYYTILQRLDAGGMGEIYLARDERFPRKVALKAIQIDYSQYSNVEAAQEGAKLFLREAQAIAQFNHRHILQLYDVGQLHIQNTLLMYMVMPYCSEGSLTDWLQRKRIPLPLPPQDVAYIVSQAADALQHAHNQGIIHQDVKLSNFLVQDEVHQINQLHLQLADFGVAKLLATTSESQDIRGTPLYMAPEQWEGQAVPATDQYALAIMAYELLTGRPPFAGTNPQQLWYQHKHVQPRPPSAFNSAIPLELDAVILRALQKNPEQRYRSINLFAQAFQRALITNTIAPSPRVDPRLNIPPTANAFLLSNDQPQHQPKHGIRSRAILQFLVVVLLIGMSIGLFFYIQTNNRIAQQYAQQTASSETHTASSRTQIALSAGQTSTSQANGTESAVTATTIAHTSATASAGETATADANATNTTSDATATAIAGATATANAEVTATITTYGNSLVGKRQPVLNDPLIDNSAGNGWDEFKDGSCAFVGSAYHAAAATPGIAPCFAKSTQFSNFSYQVTITINKGDQAGIIFCADTINDNFYDFSINTNGSYSLRVFTGFTPNNSALAQGTSAAINTALGARNVIAVKINGNAISLFINLQLITTVSDNTFSQGAIGVVAEDINSSTDATFSDVLVWT
jgi:serine/threonine protein kinase